MSGGALEAVPAVPNPSEFARPKTVGECRGGPRPCPWVSCRYNLLLDVDAGGRITLNVPKVGRAAVRITNATAPADFEAVTDRAVDHWYDAETPPASCLMDEIASEHSLEAVADLLCLTRERVRQVEGDALAKLRAPAAVKETNGD